MTIIEFNPKPNSHDAVCACELSPSLLSFNSKTYSGMSMKCPMKKLNLNINYSFAQPKVTKGMFVEEKKLIIKDPLFSEHISCVLNK